MVVPKSAWRSQIYSKARQDLYQLTTKTQSLGLGVEQRGGQEIEHQHGSTSCNSLKSRLLPCQKWLAGVR